MSDMRNRRAEAADRATRGGGASVEDYPARRHRRETRKLVTPKLNSRLDLALGLPPSNHIMVENARDVHLDGNDLVAHHVEVLLADVSSQTSILER